VVQAERLVKMPQNRAVQNSDTSIALTTIMIHPITTKRPRSSCTFRKSKLRKMLKRGYEKTCAGA
jgi:hypothetical protein